MSTDVSKIVQDAWERAPLAHVVGQNPKRRYILTRRWQPSIFASEDRPALFWMLNPSYGDGLRNDHTITRCCAYGNALGAGGIAIVNWSPIVATDPEVLFQNLGEFDDLNAEFILATIDVLRPIRVIAAWGNREAEMRLLHGPQMATVLAGVLQRTDLHCLHKTKGGAPGHPARLANALQPVLYASRSP